MLPFLFMFISGLVMLVHQVKLHETLRSVASAIQLDAVVFILYFTTLTRHSFQHTFPWHSNLLRCTCILPRSSHWETSFCLVLSSPQECSVLPCFSLLCEAKALPAYSCGGMLIYEHRIHLKSSKAKTLSNVFFMRGDGCYLKKMLWNDYFHKKWKK